MVQKSKISAAHPESAGLSKLSFFGPPPLLQGEDPTAYDDLLVRVSGQLKPCDIIEEIWVREIADSIWGSLRWRRDLLGFLNASVPKVLQEILPPLLEAAGPPPNRSFLGQIDAAYKAQTGDPELVYRFLRGEQVAISEVNALLASAGWTMEHVRARAAAKHLDTIERFNRLITTTEARRDALLREIERRRAVFAYGLRQQVKQIEQAEYEAVTDAPEPMRAPGDAVVEPSSSACAAALDPTHEPAPTPAAAIVEPASTVPDAASCEPGSPSLEVTAITMPGGTVH